MKKHIYFVIILVIVLASCAKNETIIEQQEEPNSSEELLEEQEQEEVTTDSTTIVNNNYSYLFTAQAKTILQQRFDNEYVTGPGFTSDFTRIKEALPSFLANPSQYRPVFGSDPNIPSEGEILHMAALYAYAMNHEEVANVVATEILTTLIENKLSDPFWNTNPNFSAENDLFIQTAKVKKIKDSYYFIKIIQNILTDSEKLLITNWLAEYKDLVWAWAKPRLEGYWGNNWQNVGLTTFLPEGLYPSGIADAYPIKDSNGNAITDYGMSWAQDHFSNRTIDNITYLHAWAVTNNDGELEHYCREYVKNVIKYGTFSDGTFWELIRNDSSDNTRGVYYTNVSLTGIVYMAHIDAMSNNFPNDRLYDFTTTIGIENWSTNLTQNPYPGGSTTDGLTQKSIKTLLIGQSKYLRTAANGGWADLRFNNGSSMSTVNKRQNSVLAAIANLYYKEQELKQYYMYDTSVGYPTKVTIYEGWSVIEDYGAWGNFIIGGAWFEQEQNFFN
ncbi:hypothetical protein GH721_06515 [Kriegella sp. EG-1]|nr:hypothetical protein [Flavobacteriaceae bacterium EG-1]